MIVSLFTRSEVFRLERRYVLEPHQQQFADKVNPYGKKPIDSALNGDQMRLGKTIQGMERDARLREWHKVSPVPGGKYAPTLVVCPTSGLEVWETHLKLLPDLKVLVLDQSMPKDLHRIQFVKAILNKEYDVYVCHWESLPLPRTPNPYNKYDMHRLPEIMWFHIIADEVHRAKNRKAQQTRALKKLKTSYKTGLSGTWDDNKPEDAWSVLNWLYPRTWSAYHRFVNETVLFGYYDSKTKEIVSDADDAVGEAYKKAVGIKPDGIAKMHKQMGPFYVRRERKKTGGEFFTKMWVDLAPGQRKMYDAMRKDMLAWVGEHEDQPLPAMAVVSQLVRLQQFALASAEIIEVPVNKWCRDFHCTNTTHVHEDANGDPIAYKYRVMTYPVKLREPSSKLDKLEQFVKDNPNEQFIFGSQSRQILELWDARLQRMGMTHGLYTGKTVSQHKELPGRFRSGEIQHISGTLAAMREAVDLSNASATILLDRAWNPSWNEQFISRMATRQGRRIDVIDVMARNTVDLGRRTRIEEKWSWLKQMLGPSVEVE
jgi:SNF2 family DNA or RNA helicase